MSLLQAPLSQDIGPAPKKRKAPAPDAPREWKIQAAAVKLIRERMRYDKALWYEVNLIEGAREPHRRALAAAMGMQRGPNDLTLYRIMPHNATSRAYIKTHRIEFKLPGNKLTPEQEAWFGFHRAGNVQCDRVDNLQDFIRILDGF